MPEFTEDWSGARNYWLDMFKETGLIGKPGLKFLEVGCFEGMTTLWLLENVLLSETSYMTVVDTFEGSPEFPTLGVTDNFTHRFFDNTKEYKDRINVMRGKSCDKLKELFGLYDFIYIDGSHYSADVLTDAVLCWPHLRNGSLMVFDDYGWGLVGQEGWERPQNGIDGFLLGFYNQLKVRYKDYQLVVQKEIK